MTSRGLDKEAARAERSRLGRGAFAASSAEVADLRVRLRKRLAGHSCRSWLRTHGLQDVQDVFANRGNKGKTNDHFWKFLAQIRSLADGRGDLIDLEPV